jgi:lysophospholipase L1-like esterase
MIICCFGDSTTLGIGDEQGLGWPGRLARNLDGAARGIGVYNLGVRADTSVNISARWQAEARARFKDDKRGLVFCFGTADAAQSVPLEQSLEAGQAMLTQARELAPTFFLTPPPMGNAEKNAHLHKLAAALLQAAQNLRLERFDLYSTLNRDEAYRAAMQRGDGVHPDAAGYDRMAEILEGWSPLRTLFQGNPQA